jgi:hypothetical protein
MRRSTELVYEVRTGVSSKSPGIGSAQARISAAGSLWRVSRCAQAALVCAAVGADRPGSLA